MITLKIKDPGHTIAIPGLKVFRSPANIDISKLDIRIISMYLKTSGIINYEIVAESPKGEKEIYTDKDFDIPTITKKVDTKQMDRLDKLEKMMETLLARETSKIPQDEEQINNKLDKLERLISTQKSQTVRIVEKTKNISEVHDPDIEELESFIPEVDISDMKLKSGNVKTVKQDDDGLEDTADLLFGLIKK